MAFVKQDVAGWFLYYSRFTILFQYEINSEINILMVKYGKYYLK